MRTAVEILGLELLAELKAAGFAVVHSQPTREMIKAGQSLGRWHRMVGQSIRQQCAELTHPSPACNTAPNSAHEQ
jgi:hypothetical protein